MDSLLFWRLRGLGRRLLRRKLVRRRLGCNGRGIYRSRRGAAIGIGNRQASSRESGRLPQALLRRQPVLDRARLILERIPDELPLLIRFPSLVDFHRVAVVVVPPCHASKEGSENRAIDGTGRRQLGAGRHVLAYATQ